MTADAWLCNPVLHKVHGNIQYVGNLQHTTFSIRKITSNRASDSVFNPALSRRCTACIVISS